MSTQPSSSPLAKESQLTRLRSLLPESDARIAPISCPAGVTAVYNELLASTESCFYDDAGDELHSKGVVLYDQFRRLGSIG